MVDYGRRFLIVLIIAVCIGLMFVAGTVSKAYEMDTNKKFAGWLWPAEGVVSDHFGTRGGAHKGVDIAGPLHTNIVAVSDGIVSKSYFSNSYGNVVFIQHTNEGYETVYAHLNKRFVNEGQVVKQGQTIGEMGNTGRSRGVHLHFEVHHNNWSANKENAINPLMVINKQKPENEIITLKTSVEVDSQPKQITKAQVKGKHIVKKGDTLWSISKIYGMTVDELKQKNKLTSDTIVINQNLLVNNESVVSKEVLHLSKQQ